MWEEVTHSDSHSATAGSPCRGSDPIPDGFEAEHFGCRDYRISREDSPGLRGGGLSPRRVSANDADSHSRQSPAALRSRIVHARDYSPPNWFSHAGVRKKRRMIELRGLPSFKGWRFITVTLDPSLFDDDALAGYLGGKDRMRRFLYAARQESLWEDDAAWAWKMEFHENGWTHWHLLVERTAKFTGKQLARLSELWGLGRVNVERVRVKDFLYSFKYAFKAVTQADGDEHDGGVWLLCYRCPLFRAASMILRSKAI